MADVTQFNFELRELTIALIRLQNLREGKWSLGFEFNFGAANMGPANAEMKPSAIVAVKGAILVRQPADAPELPFTVDAAEVNPESAAQAPTNKKRGA